MLRVPNYGDRAMSKSVPSDGVANRLVLAMCKQESGLAAYPRSQVDAVLNDETLKSCEYGTLALLAYCYREAFGAISCPAQKHLEVKAWQSSHYREYMGARKGKRKGAAAVVPDSDPLAVLAALHDAPAVLAADAAPAQPAETIASEVEPVVEAPAPVEPTTDSTTATEIAVETPSEPQAAIALSEVEQLVAMLGEDDK